ncbi:Uncharacterized membrane protein YczE [Acetoanaerobium noterae]|uniref:Uncharacterized membrane protein YczE n=2 Tax=Acetoanaerobium noterae TaxID=745369 RepID=A0A1T5C505_9FIRM|nr:hypothetical protein [Acetoanaerobium noterae]SKB54598.1 Uncharacterized membrane protein YczE [Acetoanaerobium noterae]
MQNLDVIFKRLPKLMMGFILIAIGTNIMKASKLGLNSWGAFNEGLTVITGISFGRINQMIGIAVLIIAIFIKIYPGIGTILNMYFIGLFIDIVDSLAFIGIPVDMPTRLIYLFVGLFIFHLGGYMYMSCELGCGPRDSLMIGLIKITGKPVSYIRTIIEATVLVLGILLGGTFGIGTIVNTFLGGPLLGAIYKFFKFDPKKINQINLFSLNKQSA